MEYMRGEMCGSSIYSYELKFNSLGRKMSEDLSATFAREMNDIKILSYCLVRIRDKLFNIPKFTINKRV